MGRLLRHGQDGSERKAAGLCRELQKWWSALWTFACVGGVEATNNVPRRAIAASCRPWGLNTNAYLTPCRHSCGSMTPRLLTILNSPLFAWAMYMFIRT